MAIFHSYVKLPEGTNTINHSDIGVFWSNWTLSWPGASHCRLLIYIGYHWSLWDHHGEYSRSDTCFVVRKWFSSTSFTFDQGMKEFMRTMVGDRTDRGTEPGKLGGWNAPLTMALCPNFEESKCVFFHGFSMFWQVRSYPSFQFCVQNGGFQTCAGNRYIFIFLW